MSEMYGYLILLVFNCALLYGFEEEKSHGSLSLTSKSINWTMKEVSDDTLDQSRRKNHKLLNDKVEKIDFRLPNTTMPLKYFLKLTAFLDEEAEKNFTFEGVVTIKIRLQFATQTIMLHSDRLEILHVQMKSNDSLVNNIKWQEESVTNFLKIFNIKTKFEPDVYTLKIKYRGNLSEDGRGFYKSSYRSDAGEIK